MIQTQLFIIGAQRCGTTFLYNFLDAHPAIHLAKPVRPEPKFFLNEQDFLKGVDFYQEKYFSELSNSINVIGEKGTSYIEYPEVANKITSYFPTAKILVMLRNPVDRALSNYFFTKDNGLESRSLEEVFLENKPSEKTVESTSVNPYAYLERGEYIKYLPPFKNVFGERMKVIIFEELLTDRSVAKEIFDFIGVDNCSNTDKFDSKVNASQTGKNVNINPDIYEKLKRYYTPFNLELERYLNKKLNW